MSDAFTRKKSLAVQLSRFSSQAIYRHLIRRFTGVGMRCGRARIQRDGKAKINSVASSVNANGTPAISRNGSIKGHDALKKKQWEIEPAH